MTINPIAELLNAAHVSSDVGLRSLRTVITVRDVIAKVDKALHTKPECFA
jgi:hypothetical protein